MSERRDPVQAADEAARGQARELLAQARFGSLAFVDAETGTPGISRIAVGLDEAGGPVTLISSLSNHHAALRRDPQAALMVGEPGAKGDPLTYPRLMVRAVAQFVDRNAAAHGGLRALWLKAHPDFGFVRLVPVSAFLNGGFGRAVRLTAEDLQAG
jgi:putative heme iron utilization protein